MIHLKSFRTWCREGESNTRPTDYGSKYFDIKEFVSKKNNVEKVSILNDVDFELELISKDKVNVIYILSLLAKCHNAPQNEKDAQMASIGNVINNNPQLRSKRELIEQFINNHLGNIQESELIDEEFERFLKKKMEEALKRLYEEEKLDEVKLKKVIDNYLYDQRKPLNDDVAKVLLYTPKLLERKHVIPRVRDKIISFVEKFFD